MAAVDFYLNETTRHANIILPPTSALEHDHYDLVFNLLAVRNVARYSPAVFDPVADSRHDWQILTELHRRLDAGPPSARLKRWLNAKIGPRRILDLGLRRGPWGSGLRLFGKGLSLPTLERAVHGIDLGPLEPCLPGRLRTPTRKIELCPAPFAADVHRLLATVDDDPTDQPLLLVGRRHLRSNNSWMHNSERLVRGRDRCTLLIHPDEAVRLGVEGGEKVAVVSRTGRVEVAVELSDEVMPGVVSLPHGWGHHRPGTRLSVAEAHPGVSINDLTDESVVDDLCGNAVLSGVPVRVEAI
jgi:anaerobic selenocysteine-containing dehydrogenase